MLLAPLILPVLNQGQHPWESNPKGVILGCCRSSLSNEEGKCTFLPLVQALTEEEYVSRKSSGLGVSVVPSNFFFPVFPLLCTFYGKSGYVFYVVSHLLKCSIPWKV